jgi:ABC-type amino acid transport substrate-binding protein
LEDSQGRGSLRSAGEPGETSFLKFTNSPWALLLLDGKEVLMIDRYRTKRTDASTPNVFGKPGFPFVLAVLLAHAIAFGGIGDAVAAKDRLPQKTIRSEGARTPKDGDLDVAAEPERTIVFATIFTEGMSLFAQLSAVYTEAFKRLDYDFKLINLPGERAMVDANNGTVAGEAARIPLDPDQYPHLIRVQEPVVVMEDGAYSADPSIEVDGFESLKGKGYTVGLLKGIKSLEQKLPQYVEKERIIVLTDFEQCLKMVQARRIGVFIGSTLLESSPLMRSGKYDDVKRVGTVEEKTLYPYLHDKHKDLVFPLRDALIMLKKEGVFQELMEREKVK